MATPSKQQARQRVHKETDYMEDSETEDDNTQLPPQYQAEPKDASLSEEIRPESAGFSKAKLMSQNIETTSPMLQLAGD